MEDRPLRADAARNAERIIAAAWAAYADAASDVPLEEIARRAGVGVATLYRRFPSKDELLIAVVDWHYAEHIEPVLLRALDDPDPWRGLVATLEAALAVAQDEMPMIKASRDPAKLIDGVMSRFLPELANLMRRGQDAGQIRADLVADDVPTVVHMLISAVRHSPHWHRYLTLMLDALRPGGCTPLPDHP